MFTYLIITEELITGITDQEEFVDIVFLDLWKVFDSAFHRLLVKKMVTLGQYHELRSSVQEVICWPRRWVITLNANKEGPYSLRLAQSDANESNSMQKCKQVNELE